MAGSDPRFNPATFRTAIRGAMVMGLPEKATFRWRTERTYGVEDQGFQPYHWMATPSSEIEIDDVEADCAVEFSAGSREQSAVGEFNVTKVKLTMLDEDYALVVGADEVVLTGTVYDVDFVGPALSLFEVTVYEIFCSAKDEA